MNENWDGTGREKPGLGRFFLPQGTTRTAFFPLAPAVFSCQSSPPDALEVKTRAFAPPGAAFSEARRGGRLLGRPRQGGAAVCQEKRRQGLLFGENGNSEETQQGPSRGGLPPLPGPCFSGRGFNACVVEGLYAANAARGVWGVSPQRSYAEPAIFRRATRLRGARNIWPERPWWWVGGIFIWPERPLASEASGFYFTP